MRIEDAEFRLRILVAASTYPTLTNAEITDLLLRNRRPDDEGRTVDSDGYVDSWDLNRAARDGWIVKAGKVTDMVTASADGQSSNWSDLMEHCFAMSDRYAMRIASLVDLRADAEDSPDLRLLPEQLA